MKWINRILIAVLLCCFWAHGDSLDSVYNNILQEEAARKQKERMEKERPRLLTEAFERDIERYLKIRLSSSNSKEDKMKLWVALCQRWGIFPIPEKPGFLVWDPEDCRAEPACRVLLPVKDVKPTIDGKTFLPGARLIGKWWTAFVPLGTHEIAYDVHYSTSGHMNKSYMDPTSPDCFKVSTGGRSWTEQVDMTLTCKPNCVTRAVWKVTQEKGLFRSEKGFWDTKYYKETL